jgi:hypothetical protein
VSQTDWVAWHEAYERSGSSMARRLALVQQRIREALDAAPLGPVRVISICAGQGRDLLEVLRDHPRREDVQARLVELDERNVAVARRSLAELQLRSIAAVRGDASITTAYRGAVPAQLVLVCGVFGNIADDDIRATIAHLPHLCAPGASVIWTRHRRPPDMTPVIRTWFCDAGFEELAFDSEDQFAFGIGTARLAKAPLPFVPGTQLFTFIGDGTAATL